MIKATPVLRNGQTGKAEVQESTMDNVCKQASYYLKGDGSVFKFFVITDLDKNE